MYFVLHYQTSTFQDTDNVLLLNLLNLKLCTSFAHIKNNLFMLRHHFYLKRIIGQTYLDRNSVSLFSTQSYFSESIIFIFVITRQYFLFQVHLEHMLFANVVDEYLTGLWHLIYFSFNTACC